jgi:ribonuclease HI
MIVAESMGKLPKVDIWSDGACTGNPGPGGWAAILRSGRHEKVLTGGEHETTNNRMEITAALQGLRALKTQSQVTIYTDSTYLLQGATEWMPNWKARGWKRKGGKLLNVDLWQAMDQELSRHEVSWVWVQGHAGNVMNERADRLAVAAIPK